MPSLEALLASDHEVVAVLTRPDARVRPRPHGRAARRSPSGPTPPASRCCSRARRASRSSSTQLAELAVDCAPVVAYGALVPQAALDLPRHGWVNLHFSLLPAWRGAAPVQHAIMAGDEVTGASTFRLEAGLDTGPVFGTVTEPIGPRDTAGDLLGRLAVSGAAAAGRHPRRHRRRHAARRSRSRPRASAWRRGSSPPTPGSTGRCPRTSSTGGSAASRPAPGAWTTWRGERLRLGPVEPVPDVDELAPGELARRAGRRPRRHRRAAPSGSATCSRPASGCCLPPTGRAAPGPRPASGWAT